MIEEGNIACFCVRESLGLKVIQELVTSYYLLFHQAWGLFNVSLERVESPKAYEFLWNKYRIITAAIKREDYQGLRVTPNVYTTLEEVDTFAGAIADLLKNGSAPTQP